jgi:hypothetical protein
MAYIIEDYQYIAKRMADLKRKVDSEPVQQDESVETEDEESALVGYHGYFF